MRDYVIINGVNSNTITGLIITKLPPISKPQMRVLQEQIDGKDGDINTPLGYSATDKPLEIGLTAEADVNEVIAYFNQAGEITFSNEPDKYYKFAIYDAIDFEKLIRFKTATINLHTQPYKYSVTQGAISLNSGSNTVVNSGNTVSRPDLLLEGSGVVNLSINNREIIEADLTDVNKILIDSDTMNAYEANSLVKSLKSDINPVQDLHGYSKPWSAGAGKNKLMPTEVTQTINGITFSVDNEGVVRTSGTFSVNTNYALTIAFLLKAGTYILNGCPAGGSYNNYVLKIENAQAQRLALDTGNGEQFTLAEDTYIWCRIYLYSQDGIGKTFKPMIRLATESDSNFAPYENICAISGFNALNVTRTGKNWARNTATSQTINEVAYTVANDGKITANGTASGASIIDVCSITLLGGNSYVLSGCPAGGSGLTYALFLRGSGSFAQKKDFGGGNSFTVEDTVTTTLSIIVYNGYNANNLTFAPMVRLSDTSTDYEAYKGSKYQTFFEGLASGSYGFVDLGSLTWAYNSGTAFQAFATSGLSNVIRRNVNDSTVATWLLCEGYTSDSINNTIGHNNDKRISVNALGQIWASNFNYTDATAFKDAMNGVYLIYELATPITPTITQSEIDTLIKAFNADLVTVIFGQTVYGGIVDVTGGKVTITHKIITVDNNSALYSSGNSAYLNITDAKIVNEYAGAISDKYEYNTWSGATNGDNGYFTLYQNTAWSNARLAFNRNGLSLADFITSLTNNPIKVVYELATPIEITTTPENLTAITGVNTVYSDTNGDTEVKVKIDGEEQTLTGELVTFNIDGLDYELGAFANRLIVGNYDNIKLEVGSNTVELAGAFTDGQLTKYSRWL